MMANAAWHGAYPKPRCQNPITMQREELISRFRNGHQPGIDFILIDLRRTDHEGGTIKGSINLPAQSLYSSLPTLLNMCERIETDTVIWYCGSSRGRGTRAAAWFDDLLQSRKVTNIKSVVLLDGIAGWVQGGQEYTDLMDEYNAAAWKQD